MSSRSRPEPSLLGRARELATIEGAVAAAREGRGTAICLLGETGMGKTSLLAATAARARDAGLDVVADLAELEGNGGSRPATAVLVDDADLLDPPSLEVVAALARRVLAAPVLLVLAARRRDDRRAGRLGPLIASVPPERTIELRPLSSAHAAELLSTLAGVALGAAAAEAPSRSGSERDCGGRDVPRPGGLPADPAR